MTLLSTLSRNANTNRITIPEIGTVRPDRWDPPIQLLEGDTKPDLHLFTTVAILNCVELVVVGCHAGLGRSTAPAGPTTGAKADAVRIAARMSVGSMGQEYTEEKGRLLP